MANFVIVLWKDPFRILGKLLVHPLVCLMNCMISVRHHGLLTLKKQRPHGPERLKEQMLRVISSLLTWNSGKSPWTFFHFHPLCPAPSLWNEWGDMDFKKVSKYLYYINLMSLVHIISTFLTLAPKSIQMLWYTYVSVRSAKLGNAFEKLLGKLCFSKESKRKCLICIRFISLHISWRYDTNIISFHTFHFNSQTFRHLSWNPLLEHKLFKYRF